MEFLSATVELTTDFGKGLYTVNAPKVQAAAGFLEMVTIHLDQLRIECTNSYATTMAIALDDQPLASSGKVLIEAGTTCRPNSCPVRPARFKAADTMLDGFRILETGCSTWQIEKIAAASP